MPFVQLYINILSEVVDIKFIQDDHFLNVLCNNKSCQFFEITILALQ